MLTSMDHSNKRYTIMDLKMQFTTCCGIQEYESALTVDTDSVENHAERTTVEPNIGNRNWMIKNK